MTAEDQLCHFVFVISAGDKSIRVYLSQDQGVPHDVASYSLFHTDYITYDAYCDDFGPMNFASLVSFVKALDQQIHTCTSDAIVYSVGEGPRALTNGAFLLGAYMLLTLDLAPSAVASCFAGLDESRLESFRDATFCAPTFRLTLLDCWCGLYRGMALGWLARPSRSGCPRTWGRIDADEYAQYDSPLNADLHEVVPGKFVALRGPRDLGGAEYRDKAGLRHFAPAHYVPIFREMGVTAVVRLNDPDYDTGCFAAAGIAHHSLPFPDCSVPPAAVVARFLAVAEAAPGAVAVHCLAGLGRTGTLIALYMMKHHGFGAREAMGWLRVMRPGCVIGEQQEFLCQVERSLRLGRSGAGITAREAALGATESADAAQAAVAAQVAAGAARRGAARATRTWAAACSGAGGGVLAQRLG